MSDRDDRIQRLEDRLRVLERERAAIEAEIAGLSAGGVAESPAAAWASRNSSVQPLWPHPPSIRSVRGHDDRDQLRRPSHPARHAR